LAKPKLEFIYKGNRIKLEMHKITAGKIKPPPAIRKAVQIDENTVMKVRTANTPKPREDSVDRIMQVFEEFQEGVVLQTLRPIVKGADKEELQKLSVADLKTRAELHGVEVPPKKKAELIELLDEKQRNQNITQISRFVVEAMKEIPLAGYSRVYINDQGNIVDSTKVGNYQVEGIAEDGSEKLKPFPKFKRTKEFTLTDENMFPSIYEGNMLQAKDYFYELVAPDDVNRFAAAQLYADMTDYTKENGEAMGEVMAVIQPVYLIGGTTQEYIGIITVKRIVDKDDEKFVILLKLSQTNIAFNNAMALPKPGETPRTIEAKQEPQYTVGFAQLVQAMQVAQ
jgi:hypothetical protein